MKLFHAFLLMLFLSTTHGQEITGVDVKKKVALERAIALKKPVHLLVKGNSKEVKFYVESAGGTFKYAAGNICSISLASDLIPDLLKRHRWAGITEIGFCPSKGRPLNDLVFINNNIDSIHAGFGGLIKGFDGENIVLGFIDTGIDFNHPDFQNPNGSTRIKYIWDQRGFIFTNPPLPYNYGNEWTAADINSGLCTHDDPAGYNGHGTNVAGTGAGNGNAVNNFKGIAPKADIIMVATNFDVDNWTETVADAVNYIFSRADSLGKPCVINISLGSLTGSRDARDIAAQAIDYMISEKTGRVVVAACGNYGNEKYHLGYDVSSDTSFTWFGYNSSIVVPGFVPSGGMFFELYADTAEFNNVNFSLGVDNVNNGYSLRGSSPYINIKNRLYSYKSDTIKNGNEKRLGIMHTWAEANEGTYLMQVMFRPDSITNYNYRFSTTGSGKFDIWSSKTLMETSDIITSIPSVSAFPGILNYKLPDTLKTIVSSWASSPKVITVGNYLNKDSYVDYTGEIQFLAGIPGSISSNSSHGPNRIGDLKPEIASSGTYVFSSGRLATLQDLITNSPGSVAYGGMHNINSGSSFSSAIVAGIAALYLQKCPNSTYQDVRTAILNTATVDALTGTTPNYTWGNGKVNGLAALKYSNFPVQMTSLGNDTICSLDSVMLTVPSGYETYVWNTNDSTQEISVNQTGEYYAEVTNAKGCASRTDAFSLSVNPTPDKPSITRNENVLLSSAANFYQWYRNSFAIPGAVEQVLEVNLDGAYSVEVSNNYFCSNISETIDMLVSVPELENKDGYKVYPNPSSGNFSLSVDHVSKGITSIQITNVLGKEVFHQAFDNKKVIDVNLDKEPSGVYFIQIFHNDELQSSTKLIKN